jgi:hypothetical protein
LTRTSKHENTVLSITKIQYLLQPKMSSIPRTSKHENTILSITKMQYLFLAKITKSPHIFVISMTTKYSINNIFQHWNSFKIRKFYISVQRYSKRKWWLYRLLSTENDLNSLNTKRPWHMVLEIQVLVWDRHKTVVVLNRLNVTVFCLTMYINKSQNK